MKTKKYSTIFIKYDHYFVTENKGSHHLTTDQGEWWNCLVADERYIGV